MVRAERIFGTPLMPKKTLRYCFPLRRRLRNCTHWRQQRAAPPRRGTLLAGTVLVWASGELAVAQPHPGSLLQLAQRSDPRLFVAPSIVAPAASQVPLDIEVISAEAAPKQSFVRVRGLPPFVSLSEGYPLGPGSWAVPLQALPKLKANVPAGATARADLVVTLVSIEGTVLAQTTTTFIVTAPPPEPAVGGPPPRAEATAPADPSQRRGAPARPSEASPRQKIVGEQLLAQGERHLAQGTVAGARLFFRQAAEAGLAIAAMRLGATYDPNELSKLKVQGLVADVAEARKWYERARELGAPEAEQRLARLGSP
jgi:hypothetical protein